MGTANCRARQIITQSKAQFFLWILLFLPKSAKLSHKDVIFRYPQKQEIFSPKGRNLKSCFLSNNGFTFYHLFLKVSVLANSTMYSTEYTVIINVFFLFRSRNPYWRNQNTKTFQTATSMT